MLSLLSEAVFTESYPKNAILLENQLANLNDGGYLIRMLCEGNNYKKEKYGHSIALYKNNGLYCMVDSGVAIYENIPQTLIATQTLINAH